MDVPGWIPLAIGVLMLVIILMGWGGGGSAFDDWGTGLLLHGG